MSGDAGNDGRRQGGAEDAGQSNDESGEAHEGLRAEDVTVVEPRALKKTVAAAAIGNAVEWFDYGVYGYLAVTLGQVFFPPGDPTGQLLATFGAFAAALAMRPIGGIFFGALGDRIGRQTTLAATMLTMAGASFAIGLLPTFASIGVAASILLFTCRLIQGFSTGGEYGGAMTFVAEHAPDKRRGFLSSWLEFGTLAGFVLGSGLVTVLSFALPPQDFLDWGWRIPFLVGGPLGLVGLYLRLKLGETPAFEESEQEREEEGEGDRGVLQQLKETFAGQTRVLLICVGLVIAFNVTDYMLLTYMPTYLSESLRFDHSVALLIVLVVMVLMMGLTVLLGRVSDRVGRRRIIMVGSVGFLEVSIPAFLVIQELTLPAIFGGVLVLGLFLACFTSTMPASLPALFPTRIRYAGLSIGFNIAVSLFGGTTPLIVTALIAATGSLLMPAYYLMFAALCGGLAVLFMGETARRSLKGSTPTVETEAEAREVAGEA
jgi:MHS family proline/betaine transporter-like MFS transporter